MPLVLVNRLAPRPEQNVISSPYSLSGFRNRLVRRSSVMDQDCQRPSRGFRLAHQVLPRFRLLSASTGP